MIWQIAAMQTVTLALQHRFILALAGKRARLIGRPHQGATIPRGSVKTNIALGSRQRSALRCSAAASRADRHRLEAAGVIAMRIIGWRLVAGSRVRSAKSELFVRGVRYGSERKIPLTLACLSPYQNRQLFQVVRWWALGRARTLDPLIKRQPSYRFSSFPVGALFSPNPIDIDWF